MEISAENHTANDDMEMSLTLETNIGMEEQAPDADVPININDAKTPDEFFGATSLHPTSHTMQYH
jgi:hypothetical protein